MNSWPETSPETLPAGPAHPYQRILVVTSDFGGGTGTHLRSLLERRDPKVWPTTVLCQAAPGLSFPGHVDVVHGPPRGPLDRFPVAQVRRLRQFRHTVMERQPDLVHTYFTWPIIFGRILKRMGLIRHLVENREDQGFALSDWDLRLLRTTADVPDRIICVSEAVRGTVVESEGVDPTRTTVVRNGITIPEELPSRETRAETRRELGFAPDDLVVGMVANLNRAVKGVNHFLEAIPLIRERVDQARFLIVGGGEEEESLKRQAHDLGIMDQVVFAGRREDVERFYAAMDVSVLTSLSEGLSITALESMTFGLPLVLTSVGGNPEVVNEGENGYLVPPKDPQAFADAVIHVLTNDHVRDHMGRVSRRRVEREFALDRVERRYQEVYREVLNGPATEEPARKGVKREDPAATAQSGTGGA